MANTTAKGWLFTLFSVVLLLPFLQQCLHFVESGPLLGAFTGSADVTFSYKGWWDGSYQKQKTLFVNDSVGFRPDLVRLNNQVDFVFFNKLHAGETYAGPGNYLFQKAYVDEYDGADCMGAAKIRDELIKLKLIQDTLERLGKTFILVYAPSKPYFFPDKIPGILRATGGQKMSDYKIFRRLGDSLMIKQLDFNALFVAMKDTSQGGLMTKQGCHWSKYGSLLAADTLIKFIERDRKIKMPEIVVTKMHYTDTAQSPDNDLAATTNLIFPITKERFCYPEFHYESAKGAVKPKVIYIGDSFIWLWIYDGLMQNTNSDWEYWSYFRDVLNIKTIQGESPNSDIQHSNWKKSLMDADCIVVTFTPVNLHLFDRDDFFIETIYSFFYPGRK